VRRNHHSDRRLIGDDHRYARGAELLGRDEEVARERLALLLTDVKISWRRQMRHMQHVGSPEDHHLGGLHVGQLHLVWSHVRAALHHRVSEVATGVAVAALSVMNLLRGVTVVLTHGRVTS